MCLALNFRGEFLAEMDWIQLQAKFQMIHYEEFLRSVLWKLCSATGSLIQTPTAYVRGWTFTM